MIHEFNKQINNRFKNKVVTTCKNVTELKLVINYNTSTMLSYNFFRFTYLINLARKELSSFLECCDRAHYKVGNTNS